MNTTTSRRSAFTATLCGALLLLSLSSRPVMAQSATWLASPATGDWNTAGNWVGSTIPNGAADVATFGNSSTTALFLSNNTELNDLVFNAGASAFTISAGRIFPGADKTLNLSGAGITNNSGISQNFVATWGVGSGTISFSNSATAGSQTVFTADATNFFAFIGGKIYFYDTSTAGSGIFTNNGGVDSGRTEFHDSSTAGSSTFTSNGGHGQRD